MAKLKEILGNPVIWIVVCLAVAVIAVVGVIINFFSLTITVDGVSEVTAFTWSDFMASKNVDYNVSYTYTFNWMVKGSTERYSYVGSASYAVSYSDWSQLVSIVLTRVAAYVTAALAVAVLALQVINAFAKNEALYVLTNVLSFALLTFSGILLIMAALSFGTNVEKLFIDTDKVSNLVTEAAKEYFGDYYKSDDYTITTSYTIGTSASFSMIAGSIMVSIAGLIGGVVNLIACATKLYKK